MQVRMHAGAGLAELPGRRQVPSGFFLLLLLLFLQVRRELSQRLSTMMGAGSNAVFQVIPDLSSAQLYSQGLQPEPRGIWK